MRRLVAPRYWVFVLRFLWRGFGQLFRKATSWDGFWWVAGIVVVLATGATLSWRFWDELGDGKETLSTTIRNVGLVIGGVIAILLAVWRSSVAGRQADTAQKSLLNDRYERGAEMLGNHLLSVRLGGIYALKRLADEHPHLYHIQVVELFCAFVRNPTGSEVSQDRRNTQTGPPQTASRPREDVQVVLTAIGDRSEVGLYLEKAIQSFRLELHHADLSGAYLPSVNLAQANLGGANIRGAYLEGANLSGAYLQSAELNRTNLIHANLTRAQVLSADLSGVIAQSANFSGANLGGANLSDAEMRWANMSESNIGIANLSNTALEGVNLSGAVFGKGTRTTLSDPPVSEDVFARLTQSQLDEACADPENPPKIADGTIDVESGKLLAWRGKPCAR